MTNPKHLQPGGMKVGLDRDFSVDRYPDRMNAFQFAALNKTSADGTVSAVVIDEKAEAARLRKNAKRTAQRAAIRAAATRVNAVNEFNCPILPPPPRKRRAPGVQE